MKSKYIATALCATSAISLIGSIIAICQIGCDLNAIHDQVIEDMADFKLITNDAWKIMISMDYINNHDNNHDKVRNDIKYMPQTFSRIKRQYDFETESDEERPEPVIDINEENVSAQSDDCNIACILSEECPAGPRGPMGEAGEHGEDGSPGEDGIPGFDGIMDLIANIHSFNIDDSGCMMCPAGSPGPPGLVGSPGRLGDDGIMGLLGMDGKDGMPGEQGLLGDEGAEGPPGEDGEQGEEGAPGIKNLFRSGTKGPPGEPGEAGKPGSSGRSGKNGKPGLPGIPGAGGKPGLDGLDGEPGPRGFTADPGMDAGYCHCPPRTSERDDFNSNDYRPIFTE